MTPLSELTRIMRKKTLLSQEDFAKALNASVGTVNLLVKHQNSAKHCGNEKDQGFLRGNQHPI